MSSSCNKSEAICVKQLVMYLNGNKPPPPPENQQNRSSPICPKVLKPDTIVMYSPCPKVQKQLMELNVNDRVQQFNNCDKNDQRHTPDM